MAILEDARTRTNSIMDLFSDDELQAACCDYLSPPVWDVGHIGNFEELWLIQHLEETRELREGYNSTYDAFENPRQIRPNLQLLDRASVKQYLHEVRSRVLAGLAEGDLPANGFLHQMLANHEGQHQETLLQSMQFRGPRPVQTRQLPRGTGATEWVSIAGGKFSMGRKQTVGVYDNEAPPYEVTVATFQLQSTPVTIGQFKEFVDAGGYSAKEVWSSRGWDWLQETQAKRPLYWTEFTRRTIIDQQKLEDAANEILCHVTYFEAEAFAKWSNARLPTEAEWEYAAQGSLIGNTDQTGFKPSEAGAYPSNPYGLRQMLGDVWEWTSSNFEPYPGFEAYPYEEYSEVFFGGDYKVLRGGSWATRSSMASATFRNWDHPYRAQIFSGIRLAR